ncbi:thermonuclease family protein [Thermoflexus sp.]|uniref:thermonuclease family protein n=1 Tax=Thermoflexus sp. TaxID=1969742 RepID=UPI0035E43587
MPKRMRSMGKTVAIRAQAFIVVTLLAMLALALAGKAPAGHVTFDPYSYRIHLPLVLRNYSNDLACLPLGGTRQTAALIKVIDGDTIDVSIGGGAFRIRYIGIDTPEQGEPYYAEATEENRRLTEGKTLYLIKDVSETDRYGRILRYVIAGGSL